ncbi:hypothetical protein P1A145kb_p120 [Pectobacterium phage DU_PP_I]|nr:hypothetical protein P1A145kb_p120 [Pectobacterium phage DU_PP_I]ATS93837.1 hypothetical protein P12B145kb_p121 [Pectobacterium phage DU_PP_IV]
MQVKRTTVEKIRIEDINETHRLDPVEVIIENYGEGAGKIIITCWGESWTGFWGSMGGTVEEFFQRVSNDYLIGKMSDYRATEPDPDCDLDFIRSLILKERRRRTYSKEEAKEAWWYVDSYRPDRNTLFNRETPEELKCIEGMNEPWHLDWPEKENPKYTYLSRILDVVREVIKPEVSSDD